jgi:hypothetical protein
VTWIALLQVTPWSPWGRAVLSWWRGDTVLELRESRRGCRDHSGLQNRKIRRQPLLPA